MAQRGCGKQPTQTVGALAEVFKATGVTGAAAILRADMKPVMPVIAVFVVIKVILIVSTALAASPPAQQPEQHAEVVQPETGGQGAKVPWPLPPDAPPPLKAYPRPTPLPPAREEAVPANTPKRNHDPENNTPAADKVPPLPLLPPAQPKAPAPAPSDERRPPFEPLWLQPPAPPAPAREVEVEVLVKLENFRVPDSRPLLAVAEVIELAVAGRTVRIAVGQRGARQASESLELPEGEYRYTLRSTARAKGWGSYGYFGVSLTGGGTGKLRVKEGARLVLKRQGCQGRYYPVWLEPAS